MLKPVFEYIRQLHIALHKLYIFPHVSPFYTYTRYEEEPFPNTIS